MHAFLIALALGQAWPDPAATLPEPAAGEALFGARIQRTMTLLETSSSRRRWPVRILFYGQSTMAGLWPQLFEAELRKRYPQADLAFENRAIGGFEADKLARVAVHDLYPFYPDLLVFHVYFGETTGELERMIADVRRYTTSEILLLNHHVRGGHDHADETCTIHPAACGLIEFEARFRRYLAQKYGCELVDVSAEWARHLRARRLKSDRLLSDIVHHNEEGARLLAALAGRHMRFNPQLPAEWMTAVRTYEAKRALEEAEEAGIALKGAGWRMETEGVAGSGGGALMLRFEGNRVDVIAARIAALKGRRLGTARVRIDGRAPSTNPRLYAISRPSAVPGVWWPAIRRIGSAKPLVAEDWTLRILEIDSAGTDFRFQVIGSKTGPDGLGWSRERFVSKSGRVVIEPRDFTIAASVQRLKKPLPAGSEITWKVIPLFADVYRPAPGDDEGKLYQTTLAQGLVNGPHMLEIVPNGDGPVPIESIQVYRPPLR